MVRVVPILLPAVVAVGLMALPSSIPGPSRSIRIALLTVRRCSMSAARRSHLPALASLLPARCADALVLQRGRQPPRHACGVGFGHCWRASSAGFGIAGISSRSRAAWEAALCLLLAVLGGYTPKRWRFSSSQRAVRRLLGYPGARGRCDPVRPASWRAVASSSACSASYFWRAASGLARKTLGCEARWRRSPGQAALSPTVVVA